jgi:hypothetical protein
MFLLLIISGISKVLGREDLLCSPIIDKVGKENANGHIELEKYV